MPIELKRKADIADIEEVDIPDGISVKRINSASFAVGNKLYLDNGHEFLSDPLVGTVKPVGRLKKEIDMLKYGSTVKDTAIDRQLTLEFSPNVANMFRQYADTHDFTAGDVIEEAKRLTQAYKLLGQTTKIDAAAKFVTDPDAPESPEPMLKLSFRPALMTESAKGAPDSTNTTGNQFEPILPDQSSDNALAFIENFAMVPDSDRKSSASVIHEETFFK